MAEREWIICERDLLLREIAENKLIEEETEVWLIDEVEVLFASWEAEAWLDKREVKEET